MCNFELLLTQCSLGMITFDGIWKVPLKSGQLCSTNSQVSPIVDEKWFYHSPLHLVLLISNMLN